MSKKSFDLLQPKMFFKKWRCNLPKAILYKYWVAGHVSGEVKLFGTIRGQVILWKLFDPTLSKDSGLSPIQ